MTSDQMETLFTLFTVSFLAGLTIEMVKHYNETKGD